MRIVIATDKFKHSLDARAVGTHLARGLRAAAHAAGASEPIIDIVPLADGGEGTLRAALEAGATEIPVRVVGPHGTPVSASFALFPPADATPASDSSGVAAIDRATATQATATQEAETAATATPADPPSESRTALVELAAASGLDLVPPDRRDPGAATTVGTGELIRAALDRGATRIILAVGGSATTDGGAGLLTALGVRLLDHSGDPIPPGGLGLESLATADLSTLDPRISATEFVLASDVDNPLCGPRGAARVFGAQKGADEDLRARLDAALARLVAVLAAAEAPESDLVQHAASSPGAGVVADAVWGAASSPGAGVVADAVWGAASSPGAGAAGGVGFAALGILRAERRPGIDVVCELTGVDRLIRGADLVITGEGSLDAQSLGGKVPVGVAEAAHRVGVPVLVVCGRSELTPAQARDAHLGRVFALAAIEPDPARSMAEAGPLLERLAADIWDAIPTL
ncbi:glycerate kinase [Mycetocola saprophilus]|uniref:glycerate kinase n=1 Tax=Mycetocola saprophilus TaxID=76636 RepID=UPI0004C1AAFE|nr:glycerate kinase [Mycetocola saprophilus]